MRPFLKTALFLAVGASVVVVPSHLLKNEYQLGIVTAFFIASIVALGLNILVGLTGLFSLGQAGFYAIGAYGAALLALRYDLPLVLGAIIPSVVAAGLAAIIAYPTVRIRGFYLTVITIAFGIIVQSGAIEWVGLTGGPMGLLGIERPRPFWGLGRITSKELYYVIGGAFVAALIISSNVRRSSYGRAFRAVSQSEPAARSLGIDPASARTQSFALSAAFAGLGGALYAYLNQYVSPETFGFLDSVRYLLMVIVGGAGSWLGPVFGAALLTLLPEVFQSLLGWQTFAYGALLVFAVFFAPTGIAGLFGRLKSAFASAASTHGRSDWPVRETELSDILHHAPDTRGSALAIDKVSVRFGGLTALDNFSDTVYAGSVHGIIGPNGAGKSTLLNVISGFYEASTGHVLCFGKLAATGRHAAEGIARTFQNTELFGDMSVIDNVLAAFHVHSRSTLFDALLRLPRQYSEDVRNRERAERLLSYVGLSNFADMPAAQLPFGHQRRLEIARALALAPRILLLDEPAAGLTHAEIEDLANLIRDLAKRGVTVVLVEHHFELIAAVCGRVSVLDYGRLIASGSPDDVRKDPRVRDAYLGTVCGAATEAEVAI